MTASKKNANASVAIATQIPFNWRIGMASNAPMAAAITAPMTAPTTTGTL